MRFVCLQENLEKALSYIGRIATVRSQLPVTTNVLIRTTKGNTELIGTDLETTIIASVPGKHEEEGGIMLPTKTLIEVVNALPKEQVEIKTNGTLALISSGAYEIQLHGISPDEFPHPPGIEKSEKLPIAQLIPYIKQVAFACATDESRAVLTGVLVLFNEGETMLVATDGYRLSLKKIKPKTRKTTSIIVPGRIFLEVSKITAEQKGDGEEKETFLSLNSGRNQIAFLFPSMTIYTRLIEGNFPPYEKIIPQRADTKATFDKEEFFKAVKLSSVFAREAANIVKLKLTKKGLMLSANAAQVGENKCEVEASLEGEEGEIAFNSRFLLDFLTNVETKEISFEMTGPLNPGVFKIPGDDSYLHIIMPVRVQGQENSV